MSNPASTLTLVIERVFPDPPEKLWRALTENPLIAQWLMKNDFESNSGPNQCRTGMALSTVRC
jgi:uncharacterized protein YndB with AHSA1/START domain